MRGRIRLIAVLAGTIAVCTSGQAQSGLQDYSQWFGKDRDGSASGFVAPSAWPDALTRRWRVEVGAGYAPPLIVGNVVYVFSRSDGREILSALDANTGAKLWQSGYDAPYTP